MLRVIHWIERGWHLLLPVVFSMMASADDSPHIAWLIWGGWLAYVLYINFQFPFARAQAKNLTFLSVSGRVIMSFIPFTILLYQPFEPSFKAYVYHSVATEITGLIVALLLMVIAGKGINDKTSWKTFGPLFVLFIIGLFVGCVGPFALEYIRYLKGADHWALWYSSVFIVFNTIQQVSMIIKIRDGKVEFDDNDSTGAILAAVGIFLFGQLVYQVITQGFD